MVTAAMILEDTFSLEEKLQQKPRQHIEKQNHQLADKSV